MTETGRDVVERLRSELERVEAAPYVTVLRVERDDLRAVLAVVEAAQEVDGFYEAFRTTGDLDIEMLDPLYQVRLKLADLHSQASDEGKA